MAIITALTFDSASTSVAVACPQGIAFNPTLTRFYATDKTPGAGSTVRRIFEYDADYNLLRQSDNFDPADGLPADLSQINGITWWAGKLYVGYNNYPNEPRLGGIIVVDPTTLTIDAIHPAGNGHVEGCTIRNTARGPEAFVFSNTGTTIERYDLATWTLQGTHDFGHWAVADDQAVYQGGDWFGDYMVLTLHGNQPRPQTIDLCRWDDTALEFIPIARLEKPTPYCGQGLNFTHDRLRAYCAERNIIPTPDEYRIVTARVSSVETLPYEQPNAASAQLEGLQYWYQRLAWNAAGPAWELPDTLGNAVAGSGFDGTRVYPILATDGTRKIRFDGEDGSSIALGNLFGAGGWTQATISMRGVVVHRNDANDILFSFDAAGTNTGDGVIEVNRDNARSISFRYGATTLTTPGGVFQLGVPFDPVIQLRPDGARIYVNGVLVASNAIPGQIGGANQDCYLGSNLLGQAGAQFDCWDLRLYNTVKDPTELASFDMWIEETMGTVSAPARTALTNHYRNKQVYTPAATHYAHAYVAGVPKSDTPVSFANNGTSYGAPSGRSVALAILLDFAAPVTDWGAVDEIRITDNATPGAGLEIGRHTLPAPITIGVTLGPGGVPTGPLRVTGVTLTMAAGCFTNAVAHELLGLMCGAVANSPRATVYGTYFAGDPQGAGAETSAARTAITQATAWGAASSGLALTAAPIALADESDATHYAEYSASSGGTLLFSAQLPVSFTPPVGGIIPAGGLRTSIT